jgi:hypothetical protein
VIRTILFRVCVFNFCFTPYRGITRTRAAEPTFWTERANGKLLCAYTRFVRHVLILVLRVTHRLHPRGLELSMLAMRIWRCNDYLHLHLYLLANGKLLHVVRLLDIMREGETATCCSAFGHNEGMGNCYMLFGFWT